MNCIPSEAWGLIGVALGFLGSLIIMRLREKGEAHRIADQRRYERAKDRVDKVERHIRRLKVGSDEVKSAAVRVLDATLGVWRSRCPRKPSLVRETERRLHNLEQAVQAAKRVRQDDPGIILEYLGPDIVDGLDGLRESLINLIWLGGQIWSERVSGHVSDDEQRGLEYMEGWAEDWRGQILAEHEIFEGGYTTVIDSVGNLLEYGYRPPSWSQTLREWWERRRRWHSVT